MLMGFVSVPLTVHYLGAERYGVWLTISSLLFWVALTDFGLAGNALVYVLSETVGKGDRVSARHYTASAFWALATIALVVGVAFIIAFHFIPWRVVFRVSNATSTRELEWTCALVLTLFVINLLLSLVRSLYKAHQDGYLANMWGIAYGVHFAAWLDYCDSLSRWVAGASRRHIRRPRSRTLGKCVSCFHPPLPMALACPIRREMDLHSAPAEVGRQIHDHATGRIGDLPEPGDNHYSNARPFEGDDLRGCV